LRPISVSIGRPTNSLSNSPAPGPSSASADAKSGRQIVIAVWGGVPIASVDDITAVAGDGDAIAAAMQQGY
jgi:uncharacterized protein GlcG (DUF336 family)